MDNANIKLYKDGDDIIVVFKNPSQDLNNMIMSMLNGEKAKDICGLEPPVKELAEKPEIDKYEEIIPEFLADDTCVNLASEKKVEEENYQEYINQGVEGFIKLVNLSKNKPDSESIKSTLKKSYEENIKKFFTYGNLANASPSDLTYIINSFYPLTKDVVEKYIVSKKCKTTEEFTKIANQSSLRSVCYDIANEIKKCV